MIRLDDVRSTSAPPLSGAARGMIRWVSTSNPFYVLSALLFLVGLWVSFGDPKQAEDTWAMMSGLAGYTLLLAVAALLLVRFGNVWDDVRTVLLLVVLMFLATSVTFDEVLVLHPQRGLACNLGGLLFAVALSEGLLRGIRLALPVWFRLPYYLILALFFLYPLALSPLVSLDQPHNEVLMWGLFGFSPLAGVVFLTLLPAIRRGPEYVRDNGSPWGWPLFPWALFGLLACAVPARAFLLCWSMHLLKYNEQGQLIFGLYFLVPFGLAVALLLLEIGLCSRRRELFLIALAMPVGLIALARFGHSLDPVYREFLSLFADRLGGDPLYLTLLACAGFYGYAAIRRVPLALEALGMMLTALAFVGPQSLDRGFLAAPALLPLSLAALLLLVLGLYRSSSWRCLIGAAGLAVVAALSLPSETATSQLRWVYAFHLALLAVLAVGGIFADAFARLLRTAGACLVLPGCLVAMLTSAKGGPPCPPWLIEAYPLLMASILLGYYWFLDHRLSLVIAILITSGWLSAMAWHGYWFLRQAIVGLDYLVLSLTLLGLAFVISLGKSGQFSQWWLARKQQQLPSTD